MKSSSKLVFVVLFVIFAFVVMFYDAQEHIGFKEKPSMALMYEIQDAPMDMSNEDQEVSDKDHMPVESHEHGVDDVHEDEGHIHGVDDDHGPMDMDERDHD